MIDPEELSYILTDLGEDREQYFNAIAPPIIQSSNFKVRTVDELRGLFQDEMSGWIYSRGRNPTVDILRKKLAALDGAEDALVFANGAAAIFAGVISQVKAGDHIVSIHKPYSWAQKTFDVILSRFGVSTTYVNSKTSSFEEAIRPNTKLIYLESPNSWTYEIQDLRAISKLAKSKGIVTMIDNTFCSPLHQRPIELGIDIVMQTATKFISGHSDTLGGVLSGSATLIKKIFESEYLNIGSGISPFNAWLLLRGLRTMDIRLKKISENTRAVAWLLENHPLVEQVLNPMLPSFPQHQLARAQMTDAPGLLTLILKPKTRDAIVRFCEERKRFAMAVSWGGHESLILPRCAAVEPENFDPENVEHLQIRIYTGLEEATYLTADLKEGLDALY